MTWRKCRKKFPHKISVIILQPVVIQNYDVLFVLVLHFCTGVTLELHSSQPIRIEYLYIYIVLITLKISLKNKYFGGYEKSVLQMHSP